jgi:hypothetical protein
MTDYGVAYGHTGWIPGYVSFVGYLPEEDITFAFQFNAAPSGEIQDPIPLAKERILKLLVERRHKIGGLKFQIATKLR